MAAGECTAAILGPVETASLDLNLLRTFLAVYRSGSFTGAARLLGLSQPTVTTQMRALERQTGRELFERLPRGVTPTPVADELAARIAAPLDELAAVAGPTPPSGTRTEPVHLAGPAELLCTRVLPALAPLVADGVRLRVATGLTDPLLDELRAGRHDLVIATTRPRGRTLHAVPLTDEEFVLVTAPVWAERLTGRRFAGETGGRGTVVRDADAEGGVVVQEPEDQGAAGRDAERPEAVVRDADGQGTAAVTVADSFDPAALHQVPLITYAEDLPIARRYWRHVFGRRLSRTAAVTVPDLRGVLAAVAAGAGFSVLPRYLCQDLLASGALVALLEPEDPPINTGFLVQRPGASDNPDVARVRALLLRAARSW
ncbi:LysR substrate-binding domain-containing protein [Streptomyces flaveolus]|uniref:LysR substrate-binding domain-containing protein n=1 Tax=Streptomyces flaveolus TaxID=67297 RepID=UPI003432C59D